MEFLKTIFDVASSSFQGFLVVSAIVGVVVGGIINLVKAIIEALRKE